MTLAATLRPQQLEDVVGQTHLLGINKPFRLAIEKGQLHSCIFWGPPGTGKTTLAELIAKKERRTLYKTIRYFCWRKRYS